MSKVFDTIKLKYKEFKLNFFEKHETDLMKKLIKKDKLDEMEQKYFNFYSKWFDRELFNLCLAIPILYYIIRFKNINKLKQSSNSSKVSIFIFSICSFTFINLSIFNIYFRHMHLLPEETILKYRIKDEEIFE